MTELTSIKRIARIGAIIRSDSRPRLSYKLSFNYFGLTAKKLDRKVCLDARGRIPDMFITAGVA